MFKPRPRGEGADSQHCTTGGSNCSGLGIGYTYDFYYQLNALFRDLRTKQRSHRLFHYCFVFLCDRKATE